MPVCSGTNLDGNVDVLESLPQVILLHPAGYVAQVEGGAGRVDILVVFTAWFLEPVKARVGVVFSQTSVRLTVLWQLKCIMLMIIFIIIFHLSALHYSHLNVGVLAVHHPDYFPPQLRLVEMIDGKRRLLGLSHLN